MSLQSTIHTVFWFLTNPLLSLYTSNCIWSKNKDNNNYYHYIEEQFLLYMHARSNLIPSIDFGQSVSIVICIQGITSRGSHTPCSYDHSNPKKLRYILFIDLVVHSDLIDTVLKLIFFFDSDSIIFNENYTLAKKL